MTHGSGCPWVLRALLQSEPLTASNPQGCSSCLLWGDASFLLTMLLLEVSDGANFIPSHPG